ncbi:hypothetical protein E0Z10_g4491 [Xylaria hypoxylon]|uniref:Uncharacterized protein n=1 Tax=Xylaria hypoxylon TaxID=37992 RepID=A0A4Z0YL12_9PEZI|nr:hypothetical protein E0Z10_g4491 [Xylaria hypoxylon]
MNDEKVYRTSRKVLPAEFVEETKGFFHNKCPSVSTHDRSGNTRIYLVCGFSHLVVNEKWEIRLPHPDYPHPSANDPEKLVYAHHINIEFMPGGPKFEEWEDIAKEFQDRVLPKYDLLHAAVEFTQLGGYGITSAWYPPKIEKDKLRSFFGSDDSDGLDLESKQQEYKNALVTAPKPRLNI